jgi:hypothetical protein
MGGKGPSSFTRFFRNPKGAAHRSNLLFDGIGFCIEAGTGDRHYRRIRKSRCSSTAFNIESLFYAQQGDAGQIRSKCRSFNPVRQFYGRFGSHQGGGNSSFVQRRLLHGIVVGYENPARSAYKKEINTHVLHFKLAQKFWIPQAKRNFLRSNISLEHYRTAPKYKVRFILKIT